MRSLSIGFLCLCVVLALGTAAAPLARAYVICENPLYSYVGVNANYMTVVHPSSTTYKSAEYQVFRVNYNETMLDNITLGVQRIGNPNGVFRMALYSVSGVAPNQVPNAAIETSSTDFNPNTLTVGLATTAVWVFAGTTEMYVDVDYCWVLYEYSEVTIDATNYLGLLTDTTATSGDILDFYGNLGYYYSSTWNIGAAGTDFVFEVRGSGGDPVEYVDVGGETINYYVTNTTVSADVSADVSVSLNNTAVSAGDVVAGDVTAGDVTAGDVTASGGVTANFNNTAVSAGDVVASGSVNVDVGGVTADFNNTSVSASAANATVNEVVLDATIEGGNMTITGLGEELTEGINVMEQLPTILFVLAFVAIQIFFMVKGNTTIGFIIGIIGFGAGVATMTDPTLALYPYSGILLIMTAALCMIVNAWSWRNGD